MARNPNPCLHFLLDIVGLHTQPLRQGPDRVKTADTRRVVVGERRKPRVG